MELTLRQALGISNAISSLARSEIKLDALTAYDLAMIKLAIKPSIESLQEATKREHQKELEEYANKLQMLSKSKDISYEDLLTKIEQLKEEYKEAIEENQKKVVEEEELLKKKEDFKITEIKKEIFTKDKTANPILIEIIELLSPIIK